MDTKRIRKALRPEKSGDERSGVHIYKDGTLVVGYRRQEWIGGKLAGTFYYWKTAPGAVEIEKQHNERYNTGRAVLKDGAADLLLLAKKVYWYAPSLEMGSDSTREKGLPIGGFVFRLGNDRYRNSVCLHIFPCLSGDVEIVDRGVEETFNPKEGSDPVIVIEKEEAAVGA